MFRSEHASMHPHRVRPAHATRNHQTLLIMLLAASGAAGTACDGKPCSPPPDYAKYDKTVDDALDGLLNDAKAYELQRKRVHDVNKSLAPVRDPFRAEREVLREKMVNQLVAVAPDGQAFHKLIDDMKASFMRYVRVVIDRSLPAHRWFTAEQRVAMTRAWEKPPEPYKIPWSTRRAIDLAMFEVSATEQQKGLVNVWRDKMESETDGLLKSQHAVRMKLIGQWHSAAMDGAIVHAHIDEGANQIAKFVHLFADAALAVTTALTPQQRMWTNKQVNKLRRCSSGPSSTTPTAATAPDTTAPATTAPDSPSAPAATVPDSPTAAPDSPTTKSDFD